MKWLLKKLRRHRNGVETPYVATGASLSVLLLIAVVLIGASFLQYTALNSGSFAAVVSAVLVDLGNRDRLAHGVGVIQAHPLLTQAAQAKANDMATRGYFSHNDPEGREPWHWIDEAGYAYASAGENLAVHFSDSQEVEQAWLDSPTHRANLLDGRYVHVGIATAQGTYQGRTTTFVVQFFGAPGVAATPSAPVVVEKAPVLDTTPGVITSTEEQEESQVLGVSSEASIDEKNTAALDGEKVIEGAPVDEPLLMTVSDEREELPWWAYALSSPWTYLRYIYVLLGFVFTLLAAYVILQETRQRHYRHVMYVAGITMLFYGLLVVAGVAVFIDPIVL